jgi:UDP-2-acetamido-3-amino-2,3-dideoxy-glucuronate N-acetyltransferase
MSHFYQHPLALVEDGATIGNGTRIWAFAHIVKGAVIGEDCNICDHTFIEGGVRLGHRVTIKSGVYLWDGLQLEDDVFIGPAAVFTNDYRPRSRKVLREIPQTLLKEGCTIGANSTTLPGLTIGQWAMVGAGAVVTRNVPDFALVRGNPARLVGWVCRCGEKLAAAGSMLICPCGRTYTQVAGNRIREALKTEPAVR